MKPLNHSQQQKLFDPACARPVTVIGVGAVGSCLAWMLAKKGVTEFTLYDGDNVESHNEPMSMYDPAHLGQFKVEALADILGRSSGVVPAVRPTMYGSQPLRGAVAMCVDSMEARQAIWKQVRAAAPAVDLLVDTRVASELVSVFAINPSDHEDVAFYEPLLAYSREQAVRPLCGLHGVIDVSLIAAVRACTSLTRWWSEGTKKRHHMELVGSMAQVM